MKRVALLYGDPYDFQNGEWQYTEQTMEFEGAGSLFDYWRLSITPTFRRLRYGFSLDDGKQTLIYTEKGFYEEAPTDDVAYYFCLPYLHQTEKFSPPAWVKDTVWYQIFPERFANGNSRIDPAGTLPRGSTNPTRENFFGGDFQGIINHIDYLVELGISGIYLTPIFKAYSNHKYDTIDYMEIDPQFGDKETFRKLVKVCQANGIRIMLDAVLNHAGQHSPMWQDVLAKGAASPYVDWFHIHGFPIQTTPKPNYDTFSFEATMPKFNTQNKETKAYLLEVGRYWVREFGIDGWRLDVANEVDHQFWQEFRKEIKKINPDVYILGEIWHDSLPWLRGDQFDGVMNYPFREAVINYFGKGQISTKQFQEAMADLLHMYPSNIQEVLFNLLGSHDTPRVLTVTKGSKERVKLLFLFLLTFTGTPCIYYGDEVGITGEQDPGCRKCMVWEHKLQDRELFQFVQRLIFLRKMNPDFGNGSLVKFHPAIDQILHYQKGDIHFFINNCSMEKVAILPNQGAAVDLWTGVEISSGEVSFPPFGFIIVTSRA